MDTDCKEKPLEGVYRLGICFPHLSWRAGVWKAYLFLILLFLFYLPYFTFLHKLYSFLTCYLISSLMILTVSLPQFEFSEGRGFLLVNFFVPFT